MIAIRQRFGVGLGRTGVRKAQLAVAISASLHATAVAWVATRPAPSVRPAPRTEPPHLEILPPQGPDPVAIAVLDARALREIDRAPRPTRPTRSPVAVAIPRGHREPSGRTRGEGPPEPHPGPISSPLMTMRGPEHPARPEFQRGPSPQWVDEFLRQSKPLEPAARPTGELHPSGNGHHRSNQGTFTLDVDPDGAAHITDEPNLRVGSALPGRQDIGKALSHWSEDPTHDTDAARRQQPGEYKALGDDDKPTSSNIATLPVAGGTFDLTDLLMRRHGQDPYASKKLKVLDATRDERAQIGAAHRHDQLAHATQLMKAALERVWASNLDLPAKKRALFELWDDCAETGAGDLVEATRQGRAYLIGFVNAKLPAGSATAFSAGELAQLNAHRQSHAMFTPYSP